jgi:Fe2+ transport system protein FeoA
VDSRRSASQGRVRALTLALSSLLRGDAGVIDELKLDDVDASMLRAMGLLEGHRIEVLRLAPLGGPLHVRVGEVSFAIDRSVAASVTVRVERPS